MLVPHSAGQVLGCREVLSHQCLLLRLLDMQALLGAAVELGGESVEAFGLHLAQDGCGEGSSGWSLWDCPWLGCKAKFGGSCDFECREVFYGRLDSGSIGKGLLHGSPWQISIKRDSP